MQLPERANTPIADQHEARATGVERALRPRLEGPPIDAGPTEQELHDPLRVGDVEHAVGPVEVVIGWPGQDEREVLTLDHRIAEPEHVPDLGQRHRALPSLEISARGLE